MFEPEDDDKTAMPHEETLLPMSGVQTAVEPNPEQQALSAGTRIAEFEITGIIGIGGFGIVYLAHDYSLGRNVAIKEYMPSALATRTGGITVNPRSARCEETFSAGLRSFINEARMLALFDHPSLVKVYRFWEANGTAYMVMPHYDGRTLKQVLLEMPKAPSEDWLRKLLIPILDALELIHGKNCFHRDIAPDNILVLKDGQPVLLDFGAARQVIGDMAKNLTVILKPGYAPIEQYAGDASMPQGAWTDIYALGAVVHCAITGKPPSVSVMRLINDLSVPLEKAALGRYGERFLKGIDIAMAVKPGQRPQNVAALRELLALGAAPPQTSAVTKPGSATSTPGALVKFGLPGLLVLAGVGVGALLIWNREAGPSAAVAVPQPVSAVSSSAAPAAQKPRDETPTVAIAPAPALVPPFDPMVLLNQLYEKREPEHVVSVSLDQSRLKIGKDQFAFRVQSARAGYLYLFEMDSSKEHLNLLFPNGIDRLNSISAGQQIGLPRKNWRATAYGPAGTDHFVVLVSQHPRDFTEAGLKKEKGNDFGEFALDILASKNQMNPGAPSILAGKPICAATDGCFSGYGAAKFSIEVVN